MTEKEVQHIAARKYFAMFSGNEDIFAIKEFSKLMDEHGDGALDMVYWLFLGFNPDSKYFDMNEFDRLAMIEKRVIEEEGWFAGHQNLAEAYRETLVHHVAYELAMHREFMDGQRKIILDMQTKRPELAMKMALEATKLIDARKKLEDELANVQSQETRAKLILTLLAEGKVKTRFDVDKDKLAEHIHNHLSRLYDPAFIAFADRD